MEKETCQVVSDNSLLPVISGLATGIGLIAVFASMFASPDSGVATQDNAERIEMRIEGLKGIYSPGEPIVFTVRAEGFSDGGIACGDSLEPLVVITNDSDGEKRTLNPMRVSLIPQCTEPREFDRSFTFGNEEQIMLDGAGSYTVTASYNANTAITSHDDITVQEKFTVS